MCQTAVGAFWVWRRHTAGTTMRMTGGIGYGYVLVLPAH